MYPNTFSKRWNFPAMNDKKIINQDIKQRWMNGYKPKAGTINPSMFLEKCINLGIQVLVVSRVTNKNPPPKQEHITSGKKRRGFDFYEARHILTKDDYIEITKPELKNSPFDKDEYNDPKGLILGDYDPEEENKYDPTRKRSRIVELLVQDQRVKGPDIQKVVEKIIQADHKGRNVWGQTFWSLGLKQNSFEDYEKYLKIRKEMFKSDEEKMKEQEEMWKRMKGGKSNVEELDEW